MWGPSKTQRNAVSSEAPFCFGPPPRHRDERGGQALGDNRSEQQGGADVYTVPEFCSRNKISRPTYHRLRTEGRGPAEMRLGLNLIRITAAAEADWRARMQQLKGDFEER